MTEKQQWSAQELHDRKVAARNTAIVLGVIAVLILGGFVYSVWSKASAGGV